ncbi:GAF domain-containing sensor histidine kinase [Neoactinobaculum massilliense]|uniref:GAF domain-containing sensor histidine kinase n=1 Tax=Neoactinobaculum massilliense TaxID=2364794 RepID=UPI000F52C68D|nr:GAF domain-containing protein [Neoactinobaculum massilliense]
MKENAERLTTVLSRVLDLTSRLDTQAVYQALLDAALTLTDADTAGIALLDSRGRPAQFMYAGGGALHTTQGRLKDHFVPPLEGAALADEYRVVSIALTYHGPSFATLALTRTQPFTDDDVAALTVVGKAAAIAMENARLYAESNSRAQWIAASRAITTALLEGSEEEDAFQLIAKEMRRVSQSEVAIIVLPSLGEMWLSEFADGADTASLLGLPFPPDTSLRTMARDGTGSIEASLKNNEDVPEPLRHFGPAMAVPLAARGESRGMILLVRAQGRPEYDLANLAMAESVAKQATLALALAGARQTEATAAQIEDRAKISRDLHDFAIQQLFASGMQLAATREDLAAQRAVPGSVVAGLDSAISSINESVTQIRQIIYSLRDPSATVPLMRRLSHEYTTATMSMGFEPSVTMTLQGEPVGPDTGTHLDDTVGSDLADDIVAVVREGLSNVARHAHATAVSVTITIEDSHAEIIITDNGKGITEVGRRSGLSNLAARARRHRGSFSISPGEHGHGTSIRWTAGIA